MTVPSRSDSQLDAEAATPLAQLIATHRLLFAGDLYIDKLTTETPPVFVDPQSGARLADDMSRLGPTLSYPLEQYLAAAPMFPWTRGYRAVRWQCRRTHTRGHHERREWHGSLCAELVNLVVKQGYAFERACYDLFVTPERAERVLRAAFRHIEAVMDDVKARQTAWKHEGQWPAPPAHVHHSTPGLHVDECKHPECVARRAA